MPRVSVIIPVYNVEDYLALSVASVRQQTLEDIEIICVNDGSTDGSREILALLEAVDSRIVVIDKPNGGLSSARNAGIDRATGEYLCFLDADDLMDEGACGAIADAFERTGADVVTYGASSYPPFRGYPWLERVLSPRDVVYGEFTPALLFDEASHPFAWRTALRRSFLVDSALRFDEDLAYGEDEVFHFALYPRSSRTALISDKLIRYRVARGGSLMDGQRGDLARRVGEHLAIVGCVLRDWGDGGFLVPWGQELFDWSAEFLLLDLLALPEAARLVAASQLRELWFEVFGEEGAGRFAAASRFHVLARLIACGGEKLPGGRVARARYYLSRLTPARLVKVLHGRLRARRPSVPGGVDQATWEAEDARHRQEALQSLRAEAAAPRTP